MSSEIFKKLSYALKNESNKFVQLRLLSQETNKPERTSTVRTKLCSIAGCNTLVVSRGLCNGHNLRRRNNKDINEPIMNKFRNNDGKCLQCSGEVKGKQHGWNLCAPCYKSRRFVLVKKILIKHLGGKCKKCKGQFDLCCYDFHHKDEKSKVDQLAYLIGNGSIKRIADEAAKCELLCANCHRMEHNEFSRYNSVNIEI